MKKLFALFLVLTAFTFAQTDQISKWVTQEYSQRQDGSGSTFVVYAEFTLDSIGGMLSPVFEFPAYDGTNFTTHPIQFIRKNTTLYSNTPKMDIFLLGTAYNTTDTLAVDTIAFQNTGVTDTTGILTLGGVNAITPRRGYQYRLLFRCLNATINYGRLTLLFTKPEND